MNTLTMKPTSVMGQRLGVVLPSNPDERKALYFRMAREIESPLMSIAYRLCREHNHAEDIVRDAVLNGYKAFMEGRVHDLSGFKPWLVRIVWNQFLADKRKSKRWVNDPDAGLETQADVSDRPDLRAFSNNMSPQIQTALDSLSPDHRLAVELVFIQEFTYEEAAKVLDVPVGTVRSRLSRARLALLKALPDGVMV